MAACNGAGSQAQPVGIQRETRIAELLGHLVSPLCGRAPSIEKSWEKHGDEVAFLLVTNQEPTVVKAFMEKHDYSFPVHYSTASAPPELAHSSIPTTYLLSPEGKIIIQKKGALNWNSRAIDKVYKDLLR